MGCNPTRLLIPSNHVIVPFLSILTVFSTGVNAMPWSTPAIIPARAESRVGWGREFEASRMMNVSSVEFGDGSRSHVGEVGSSDGSVLIDVSAD
jgi:hypothetical protein